MCAITHSSQRANSDTSHFPDGQSHCRGKGSTGEVEWPGIVCGESVSQNVE